MPNLGGPSISPIEVLMNRVQFLGTTSLKVLWTDIPEHIRGALPFINWDFIRINVNDLTVYFFIQNGEVDELLASVRITESLIDLLNETIESMVEEKVAEELKKEEEEKKKKEFDNRVQDRMVDLNLSE